MSHLLTLEDICLAFGLDSLLDHVKLQVESGERICLIGRNGAGKSSLLQIIAGHQQPDSGRVIRQPHLRIAMLEQALPRECSQTVFDYVAGGLAEVGQLLSEYHHLTQQLEVHDLKQLENLQREIDTKNGWQYETQIKMILDKLALPANAQVNELSGGWQRRAALAKALVSSPDLLLLDEPTNHLDIEAIQWLEEQLVNLKVGLIFITHDRALLQRLATRIIELDRGQLTSWPGDYQNFLRRKEEMLHAEAMQNADFDKKLAIEETWIRQGIKARRTRNEGRVRHLEAMREVRAKRRDVQGKATLKLAEAEKSGQLVVEAEHVTHRLGDRDIIKHFSCTIMRGDRIGLIGPNGIGKTTLLSILLGRIKPSQGNVRLGTKLQIAYFDQLRETLDGEKSVIDNVSEGREVIELNGQRQHIMGYLGHFLFTPQRARTPVKALSGGECNRLMLAKLFSHPTNLLVMDEPTNDLDIETLELLEELLDNYQGTLLIVSHDRTFLDNVITSAFVFEGDGVITEKVGGYSDVMKELTVAQPKQSKLESEKNTTKSTRPKKLSFNEQRELERLPAEIEKMEARLTELQTRTSSAEFYQQPPDQVAAELEKLKQLTSDIARAYERWESLEKLK